jgi:hypothetical protein
MTRLTLSLVFYLRDELRVSLARGHHLLGIGERSFDGNADAVTLALCRQFEHP